MNKLLDMEEWTHQQRLELLLDICATYGLDVDGDVLVQDGKRYYIYATYGIFYELENN